jgi:hypothetical protein
MLLPNGTFAHLTALFKAKYGDIALEGTPEEAEVTLKPVQHIFIASKRRTA